MVVGILSNLLVLTTPLILLLQFCAQYWELRKLDHFGALSLRSFGMQGAVMTVVALRLFIKTGFTTFEVAKDDGQGIFARALVTILRCYFDGFMSFNYILWTAGAALVYFATRFNKAGDSSERVELGVFLE